MHQQKVAEQEVPKSKIDAINLLHSLTESKSQLRHHMLNGIFENLKSLYTKNKDKDYSPQKFAAFFWLINFSHLIPISTGQTLTISLAVDLPLTHGGLYFEHTAKIKPSPKLISTPKFRFERTAQGLEIKNKDQPQYSGLNFQFMLRTLLHELTHAMSNVLYDNNTLPPAGIWGDGDALSLRTAMIAPYVMQGEEKSLFFSYGKREYESLYPAVENYSQEFIAEVITYCILFGELPLKEYLLPADVRKLENAIESFLTDCANYLKNQIKNTGLSQVFPYLQHWDGNSPLEMPSEDIQLFHAFIHRKSLWPAAISTGNIETVKTALALDPKLLDFSDDMLLEISGEFATLVRELIEDTRISFQASAPPSDDDSELEMPSAPPAETSPETTDRPPPMNPSAFFASSTTPSKPLEQDLSLRLG